MPCRQYSCSDAELSLMPPHSCVDTTDDQTHWRKEKSLFTSSHHRSRDLSPPTRKRQQSTTTSQVTQTYPILCSTDRQYNLSMPGRFSRDVLRPEAGAYTARARHATVERGSFRIRSNTVSRRLFVCTSATAVRLDVEHLRQQPLHPVFRRSGQLPL